MAFLQMETWLAASVTAAVRQLVMETRINIQPDPEGSQRLAIMAPEFDATFEVWGTCPVQGIGSVAGRDLYFRARERQWTFDIADDCGNLPSDGFANVNGFYRESAYREADYMSHEQAVRIMEKCLEEYFAERAKPVEQSNHHAE